jgi:hypothetical protein
MRNMGLKSDRYLICRRSDYANGHCAMEADITKIFSVTKRVTRNFHRERFKTKTLGDVEVSEVYRIKNSNTFLTFP